jgi:pyridoxine kinase
MAKILAVSSQVVFGPVGLNAIVPALQAEGHEVLALPTVLLSNHPGHGKPTGQSFQLDHMISALEKLGAFENLDAVITGYFANVEQVEAIANLIAELKPAIVLIDPVIGDHGKLYVPETVAAAIRDLLLPLATIITPNAFELSWLTNHAVSSEGEAIATSRILEISEIIATSVPSGRDLATLRITKTEVQSVKNSRRDHVPNGTGDFLSGLYLARQFGDKKNSALNEVMTILHRAISLSGDTKILAVAEALA